MTSLKKHSDKSAFFGKSILYLNRHQTEEWKGWMHARNSIYRYSELMFANNKCISNYQYIA
ncbi:hypothetical protein Hdeb2414_s0128g00805761 [Helianthus debilis subsp. tardiflorus]